LFDSFGLVNTAPRNSSNSTLDLCTGSGIQSIIASRYSKKVTAVDINPRAIRFARFNAQLNGISNITVLKGDLYNCVENEKFDTILANPPFVPSPDESMKFRDGGVNGEAILRRIVNQAPNHLSANGRLYIVTDLVDVSNYESKLKSWWGETCSNMAVLKTADRNDILFSVPHCHYPFNQTYNEYSNELIKWVNNFNNSNLNAVNFGYILIEKAEKSSYFLKTISNPSTAIYSQTKNFFSQTHLLLDNSDGLMVSVNPEISVRRESRFNTPNPKYMLFAEDNPFFTEYQISKEIYTSLLNISSKNKAYQNVKHYPFIKDLIYKGILVLSYKSKSIEIKQQPEVKEDTSSIVEMETKTTPTCLTSYLKQ